MKHCASKIFIFPKIKFNMKNVLLALTACLLIALSANAAPKSQADTAYSQYFGKYTVPDGSPVSEVEVALEDTLLTLSSSMGSSYLSRIEADSFSMSRYDGVLVFKRDDAKKVHHLVIYVMGMVLEATLEKQVAYILKYKPINTELATK